MEIQEHKWNYEIGLLVYNSEQKSFRLANGPEVIAVLRRAVDWRR